MEREKDVNQAFARLALYRERDRPDYIRLFSAARHGGPCNTAQKPRRSSSDALFHICPCGNKVPEELQQGEGLAGFHPPFTFPLAAEALATPRKSHVGLRPTHFLVYKPLRERSSRRTPTAKGISRISSAFSLPLPRRPLQHCAKATSVFVRRTFSYISPLRKQSSRGAYIRKKPNLKFGFCLCCGERGIRTPGTVTRTPHFECGPIDHSGISPICSDSFSPFTFRPFGLRVSRSPQPDCRKANQQGSRLNGVQR